MDFKYPPWNKIWYLRLSFVRQDWKFIYVPRSNIEYQHQFITPYLITELDFLSTFSWIECFPIYQITPKIGVNWQLWIPSYVVDHVQYIFMWSKWLLLGRIIGRFHQQGWQICVTGYKTLMWINYRCWHEFWHWCSVCNI